MQVPAPEVVDEAIAVIFRSLGLTSNSLAQSHDTSPRYGGLKSDVNEFDEQIHAYKLSLRAIKRRISSRVFTLCRQRNASLPIHRLPPELLSTIFMFDVHPQRDFWTGPLPTSLKLAVRLAAVSTTWRDVAFRSPPLWTVIDAADSGQAIALALWLSKAAPLSLIHRMTRFECDDEVAERHARLFQAALPHIHRWRSVNLHLHLHSAHILQSLSNHSAEALEDFNIHLHDVTGSNRILPPVDLFQGSATRLKNLSISYPVNWASSMISGLKSLILQDIPRNGPSLQQLKMLLSSCSALETLSLSEVNIATAQVPNELKDPIELPLLKNLDLNLSPNSIHAVLDMIRTPGILNFDATTALDDNSLERTLRAFQPFLQAYCRGCTDGTLTIILSDSSLSIFFVSVDSPNFEGEDVLFSLNVSGSRPEAILDWLASNGTSLLSQEWEISIEASCAFQPETSTSIGSISRLTGLEITNGGPLHHFLGYLATPLAPGGPWPLANLDCVSFNGGRCSGEEMLHMVEKRYGQIEGVNAPRELRVLGLTNVGDVDRKAYDQIVEVMGIRSVDWCHDLSAELTDDSGEGDAMDEDDTTDEEED